MDIFGKKHNYRLSIIINAGFGTKDLMMTIDQLHLQNIPSEDLEIIVIRENLSGIPEEELQRHFREFGSFQVFENSSSNLSIGRNIGIRKSTAPYLLFLHRRVHIPGKDFLNKLLEYFENNDIDCICPARIFDPPDLSEFEQAVTICRKSFIGHNPGSDIDPEYSGAVNPISCGNAYRREVFDIVGFFDESFEYGEEFDFNYRLYKAGLKSFHYSDLKIFYYPKSDIRGLYRQMVKTGKSRMEFNRKYNRTSPYPWLAAGGILLLALLALLSLLISSTSPLFRNVLGFYVLTVLLFSIYPAVKEKDLNPLLFGLIIYPVIHFGFGIGVLKVLLKSDKIGYE